MNIYTELLMLIKRTYISYPNSLLFNGWQDYEVELTPPSSA